MFFSDTLQLAPRASAQETISINFHFNIAAIQTIIEGLRYYLRNTCF